MQGIIYDFVGVIKNRFFICKIYTTKLLIVISKEKLLKKNFYPQRKKQNGNSSTYHQTQGAWRVSLINLSNFTRVHWDMFQRKVYERPTEFRRYYYNYNNAFAQVFS